MNWRKRRDGEEAGGGERNRREKIRRKTRE